MPFPQGSFSLFAGESSLSRRVLHVPVAGAGSCRHSPRRSPGWSEAGWTFALCARWVVAVMGLTGGVQALVIFKTLEAIAFGSRGITITEQRTPDLHPSPHMGSHEGRVRTSDSPPGSAQRQPRGCHIATFPSRLPYFGERFCPSEDTRLSQSLRHKENRESSPAAVGTARGTAQSLP